MKHELLKNNVYLTLLAFYNNKTMPTYVELGKISGITRQTAAKKVKELIDNNIIKVNTNNILSVDNNMERSIR